MSKALTNKLNIQMENPLLFEASTTRSINARLVVVESAAHFKMCTNKKRHILKADDV